MSSSIIIKTSEQIDGIRKSCKLAAQCLDFIKPYVIPGVTTNELDQKLETYIRDHGAVPAPKGYRIGERVYPKATCISVNEVICHGIPDEYRLKEGDILNIDVTTILDGYYGDTGRMYTAGEVSLTALNLIQTCARCLHLGIQQVEPNAHLGNIGHAITREAHLHGYSVVEVFCGHGTGVAFHEPPNVSHKARKGTGPLMLPGCVFTIEPMLNEGEKGALISETDGWTARTADGKRSAQFEHTILVTLDGHEILTKV